MSDQKVGRIEFGPVFGGFVSGPQPPIRVQPHDELGALADEVARLRARLESADLALRSVLLLCEDNPCEPCELAAAQARTWVDAE